MPENIITTEYSAEMQQSYINYSMSVITSRAVPDGRDGLKPVQRRVLYAMTELGLNSDKPHRKSARIVGDTMGKYHPHGDSSIYDALVVLSQDFKKGMALVDGHGNFGSIEGDGAAAMRYTEARLKKFTQEVYLADLDKNVIDFIPNFDETEKEPSVLPVRIPNILVNGSEGIAVGMATSIPTHNLAEVIDAMKYLMDYPHASTKELLNLMPGPDFPTGGYVTNKSELLEIYETGRGKIKLRGKAQLVPAKRKADRDHIEITEIPYTMIGANIGKFLSDVMALVEAKKLPDITDISNMSSKEGIKIVLELKKGADGEKTLQGLYKKTKLEDTFGVNMLAIANGKPLTLSLREILQYNIDFQIDINTRKYTTLLQKETEKKEIQEGLIRAVDIIDLIIEIIRGSKDIKMAKGCLVNGDITGIKFKSTKSKAEAQKLNFTEAQATAILELRLSKLIGLEILALQEDYKDTLAKIKKYTAILKSRKVMMDTIKEDLDHIKKNYGLKRRTRIEDIEEAVFEEAPIVETPVVFAMNRFGYAKTLDVSVYQKNEETVLADHKVVFTCMNTSKVGLFTAEGTLHQLKVLDLPLCKPKDKGVPLDNVCNFESSKENLVTVIPLDPAAKEQNYIFVTKMGLIKRVPLEEFFSVKKTIAATKLADGDAVVAVLPEIKRHIILITDDKMYLRYQVSDVPLQKKTAAGVRGVKLGSGQHVKSAYLLNPHEVSMISIDEDFFDITETKLKKRESGRLEKL